ncbi:MAG: PAS domain S-box protein [Hyphomicrobium sp.]
MSAARATLEGTLDLRLVAAGPDCVKLIDVDGYLRLVNDSGRRLMDVEDDVAIEGRPYVSLWPESSRQTVQSALDDARAGKVATFSGRTSTGRGVPKWWDVTVSPVHDLSGRLTWLVAIARDVSRQKSAEDQLRLSEQHFRALADHMAQFAWLAEPSGSIFWYNRRWFDYTGTTLAEMAGWGWRAVHHPDHLERVVEKFSGCIKSGEVWEDTFPLRGVDGSYRWFLSRAMPIRNDSGDIELWCGTNTDVTEQREASARLRQLARIIELSHEAILVWDLESGIGLWNRGCAELYGYTSAEAIGAISHDLLKTSHPLPFAEFIDHIKREGAWSGELLHVSKDGKEVWVDSRQELIQVGAKSVVLETNRDITERRMADQMRDLLIGELNHRVKNTLAVVQSVAAQTARSSGDMKRFMANFTGRLHSLSIAHNALTDAHWYGAGLVNLIKSQIAGTAGETDNVILAGEDVFVPPQTALQLSQILHELGTNAMRYGALSRRTGRVTITWKVTGPSPRLLELIWRESGGPEVTPPVARGFGLMLIERSEALPHLQAALTFEPDGIVCRITSDLTMAGQYVSIGAPARAG